MRMKAKSMITHQKGILLPLLQMELLYLALEISVRKLLCRLWKERLLLFKSFADVDAFPICLDTTDPEKIVETVKLLEPTFGGVNLEDIAAPRCFEIEERLRKTWIFLFFMMINMALQL